MNKHEECFKGFTHLSKAWYGKSRLTHLKYVDEVNFGFYDAEGGTSGEISMKWIMLGNDKDPSAKLEAFFDSFDALSHFKEVIDVLKEYNDFGITPEEFCSILIKCGFKDMTKTKGNSP